MEASDPFVSILQNLASIDALTNEVNFLLRNVSTQVHDVAALQGLVDFVQKLSDLGHQINFKLHCRIQHAKLRVISEPSTWFYKGCSVCSKKNCSAHHAPLGHISFYRIKVAIKDHTEKEIEAIMFGQVVKDLFHHTAQELEILKEKNDEKWKQITTRLCSTCFSSLSCLVALSVNQTRKKVDTILCSFLSVNNDSDEDICM